MSAPEKTEAVDPKVQEELLSEIKTVEAEIDELQIKLKGVSFHAPPAACLTVTGAPTRRPCS